MIWNLNDFSTIHITLLKIFVFIFTVFRNVYSYDLCTFHSESLLLCMSRIQYYYSFRHDIFTNEFFFSVHWYTYVWNSPRLLRDIFHFAHFPVVEFKCFVSLSIFKIFFSRFFFWNCFHLNEKKKIIIFFLPC